jgi:hypothetical protein
MYPEIYPKIERTSTPPRIRTLLQQEAESPFKLQDSSTGPVTSETNPGPVFSSSVDGRAADFLFFKNDCMYHHKLLRFHFTTYDVRRGTDIVNAGTSRHNVMLLVEDECDNANGSTGSSNSHPFLYARVLGAYHANVLYTGPGMQNEGFPDPLIFQLDSSGLQWTLCQILVRFGRESSGVQWNPVESSGVQWIPRVHWTLSSQTYYWSELESSGVPYWEMIPSKNSNSDFF